MSSNRSAEILEHLRPRLELAHPHRMYPALPVAEEDPDGITVGKSEGQQGLGRYCIVIVVYLLLNLPCMLGIRPTEELAIHCIVTPRNGSSHRLSPYELQF